MFLMVDVFVVVDFMEEVLEVVDLIDEVDGL